MQDKVLWIQTRVVGWLVALSKAGSRQADRQQSPASKLPSNPLNKYGPFLGVLRDYR